MENKKKLSDFSTGELINMAYQSTQKGELGIQTFKEKNEVDFSFMQLCEFLNKTKINDKEVLFYSEYSRIKEGSKKAELLLIFFEVRRRYTNYVFEQKAREKEKN